MFGRFCVALSGLALGLSVFACTTASPQRALDVELRAPSVEPRTPSVELKAPSVELKAPSVELKAPSVGLKALADGSAAAESPGADRLPEVTSGPSGPLQLVSLKEIEALPLDTNVAWTSAPELKEGPEIRIDSPQDNGVYEGPFPIKVQFLEGDKGLPVDMNSLKLEYKRAWGIDITSRVRDYLQENRIDVAEAELPRGRHTVEILIEDVENNRSSRLFTITVK